MLPILFLIFLFFPSFAMGELDNEMDSMPWQPSGKGAWAARDAGGQLWMKGEIPPTHLHRAVMFSIPSIHLTDYQLYVAVGDTLVEVDRLENWKSRFPVYYFHPTQPEFYLLLNDAPLTRASWNIQLPEEFSRSVSSGSLGIGTYYGLLLMAIIFNAGLYLIFTDNRFLVYALLHAAIAVTIAYEDGLFYYFSGGRFISPAFLLAAIGACASISGVFTYHFLELRSKHPAFLKTTFIFTAAIATCVVLYAITGLSVFRNVSLCLSFALPYYCFYQAFRLFNQSQYARFLILGFGLIVLTGSLYAVHEFVRLPMLSWFTLDSIRLATVIEVVGITFLLMVKGRKVRQENEFYRTELRQYLELLNMQEQHVEDSLAEEIGNMAPVREESRHAQWLEKIGRQHSLSEREVEVLAYIWAGYSNPEIADRLYISVNTAKFHARNLYIKLNVKNRSELRSMKPTDLQHQTRIPL